MVARALHGCQTPVVTGIGHEIDFTIADWVADLRAATPSAAAEAVSPDARDWLLRFQQRESDLRKRFVLLLQRREQQLTHIEKRLEQAHPLKRIATQRQRIDELELRLRRAVDVWLAGRRGHLDAQTHRLLRHQPTPAIELYASRVAALHRRLQRDVWHGFEVRRAHLQSLERRLALVSPLATLQRGYAVLSRESDGSLVTNAADLAPGDATLTRLARGIVYGRVEATET
jgi:exodeoxyribonuclease VII large subunit